MNIGQVLEVNLGYCYKACGIKVMTPSSIPLVRTTSAILFDTAR